MVNIVQPGCYFVNSFCAFCQLISIDKIKKEALKEPLLHWGRMYFTEFSPVFAILRLLAVRYYRLAIRKVGAPAPSLGKIAELP